MAKSTFTNESSTATLASNSSISGLENKVDKLELKVSRLQQISSPPGASAVQQSAFDWAVRSKAHWAYQYVTFGLLLVGYAAYTTWFEFIPGLKEVIVLTSEMDAVNISNTSQPLVPFPSIVIATSLNDPSAAQFVWNAKCHIQNLEDPGYYRNCTGNLFRNASSGTGLDMVVYNMSPEIGIRNLKDFINIQVFYTFNPNVTRGWYNTAFSPTAFFMLSPFPITNENVSDWARDNTLLWQNSTEIAAGASTYMSIHRQTLLRLDGSAEHDAYSYNTIAVPPAESLTTCAATGCTMSVFVRFADTLHTITLRRYRLDWRGVLQAALALIATPWAAGSALYGFVSWWRQRKLKNHLKALGGGSALEEEYSVSSFK